MIQKATFGSGCFWCVEAIFQSLKGVKDVSSGYSGGHTIKPSYREVCSGETGHAEVVQLSYENTEISFEELLEVFFQTHDPTTLNRQGADFGSQYRSVIFYHSEDQKIKSEEVKKKLNDAKVFNSPIVTEIVPFTVFYPAESEHKNYYETHPEQAYCKMVIRPKLNKFQDIFKNKLK